MVTKPSKNTDTSSIIARSDDGTVQITFSIPFAEVEKARIKAAAELGKDLQIPGFRKGLAPPEKVIANIPDHTLLEKSLSYILPGLVSDSIKKYDLKPVIYPKFELVKAVDGEDWQVRATTCELLPIELGDYKKELTGSVKAKKIWTPKSGPADEADKKELTRQQKEQQIIEILMKNIKVTMPKVLIDEEVDSRLSKLLERIEKLGLNLESYLASIGKTAEVLRNENEQQSREALALDLILTEIAKKEKVEVEKSEVDAAINAAQADPQVTNPLNTPERRQFIEVILKRRKVLDSLVSLL